MVWHADGKKLKCNYCSKEMSFPDFCPQCGSDALSNSGSGTQKIEILVKEIFPEYRVERIDSDILTKKNAQVYPHCEEFGYHNEASWEKEVPAFINDLGIKEIEVDESEAYKRGLKKDR
jgi:hypothetical protein